MLVVAEHEDVFVVSLHEITFARYLTNKARVAVQTMYLGLVTVIGISILLNLFCQLADALLVAQMAPHAVLIDKTYEYNGEYCHYDILQSRYTAHATP